MYQAFSGGAEGADKIWESEAKKIGLSISFTHYRPEDCSNLSIPNKQIVDKAIVQACKALGKLWPTGSLDLIRRNYLIVKSADIIYGIGVLQPAGTDSYIPKGGTGWSLQMAMDLHKPVYLFDQLSEQWFDNMGFWWEVCPSPVLCIKPALIGTRNLSKAGVAAIQTVLQNTKQRDNELPQNQQGI